MVCVEGRSVAVATLCGCRPTEVTIDLIPLTGHRSPHRCARSREGACAARTVCGAWSMEYEVSDARA